MKRILFLCGIVLLGTILVCGAGVAYLSWSPGQGGTATAEAPPPRYKLSPLPDADALAARMPHNQGLYQKTRDDALAAYAKLNPSPHPYDDEARAALRLFAYLQVWDDFYGENLWCKLADHADDLERRGAKDTIWEACFQINLLTDQHSNSETHAAEVNKTFLAFDNSPYPALMKLRGDERAMSNLIDCKSDREVKLGSSYDALPDFATRAVADYEPLIQAHASAPFLYVQGSMLLHSVADNDATLKAVSEGLDRAFAADDRDNPVAVELDGGFYTEDAWCARGSDYANTVTPEGWQLFGERLNRAESILTDLEARQPGLWMTSSAMMTVVLGLQEPRDQMELWFQRGIKADPNNFGLYMHKRHYLLPRWYGSDEDELQFGLQCASSSNWAAKIPLILVEALSDAGDRDPTIYAQPAIWAPLEKVYRGYLQRYPHSDCYRSRFAKSAVQGEHWDVAKEQFKILDGDWDRAVFEDTEYADMTKAAFAH